jgi:bifunctional DNA-binding transcriptional regulator/antitoxin component of YhaV-PrlF toxin-antitoxin module
MVLLRRYSIRHQGLRGHIITLPKEYIEDAKLQAGQKVAMYRDGDHLVLIPEHTSEKTPAPEGNLP